MRGMSLSLTSVELRLANDLNNICPYPHSKQELTKAHSPELVYGRPAGWGDWYWQLEWTLRLWGVGWTWAQWLVMLSHSTCQGTGFNMGGSYQWASPEACCYRLGSDSDWDADLKALTHQLSPSLKACKWTQLTKKRNTDGNLDRTPQQNHHVMTMHWQKHQWGQGAKMWCSYMWGWWPGLGIYPPPHMKIFIKQNASQEDGRHTLENYLWFHEHKILNMHLMSMCQYSSTFVFFFYVLIIKQL